MRYVELFAGAGGLSMGLEAAGMVPVAHAEIEPHARAVLRHHWPDTPLHGDVTQVDWTQYAGRVDLVAGGSPCQDLSVAGKRAGLAGARSGLFYELIRAWDETGATYCLWENVDGARSSNKGADLASVLSAFVGGSVAVPRDGWRRAGVVAGATGVAAWRVLDLQHFGPPQRRRRIFVLAARTGGVDPAQVLLEPEGLCRHPSPRERASKKTPAASIGGGVEGGCLTPMALNISNGVPSLDDTMGTLDTDGASTTAIGNQTRGVVLSLAENQQGETRLADVTQAHTRRIANGAASDCAVMDTLTATYARGMGHNRDGQWVAQDKAMVSAGRPRRLTPLECERLMGWPDQHTAHGVKEDGTAYALSDTARYRLCGNGVGTPVAAWIASRLMAEEVACPTP